MADDTPIVDGLSANEVIATDELATYNGADVSAANPRIKAQRMKVGYGSDGTFTDVDATHGLPVVVGGTTAVNPSGETAGVGVGAIADAEAAGNGSVIALLKRLRTLLAAGLPAALGANGGLKADVLSLPSLPAGANVIGHTVVDSVGGTVGVSGSVSISAALPAGTNNIGDIDVLTIPAAAVSTDSIGAAPLAETTLAGATPFKLISAASTNATSVKATVGKLFYLAVFNLNAAPRYLKLYDKASAPTVGTDTPKHVFLIPGNTAGAGLTLILGAVPAKFASGIALALTTGIADTDTGAVAANEIVVNLGYV